MNGNENAINMNKLVICLILFNDNNFYLYLCIYDLTIFFYTIINMWVNISLVRLLFTCCFFIDF